MHQVWQLGEVRRHAAGLVAGEQLAADRLPGSSSIAPFVVSGTKTNGADCEAKDGGSY